MVEPAPGTMGGGGKLLSLLPTAATTPSLMSVEVEGDLVMFCSSLMFFSRWCRLSLVFLLFKDMMQYKKRQWQNREDTARTTDDRMIRST